MANQSSSGEIDSLVRLVDEALAFFIMGRACVDLERLLRLCRVGGSAVTYAGSRAGLRRFAVSDRVEHMLVKHRYCSLSAMCGL